MIQRQSMSKILYNLSFLSKNITETRMGEAIQLVDQQADQPENMLIGVQSVAVCDATNAWLEP